MSMLKDFTKLAIQKMVEMKGKIMDEKKKYKVKTPTYFTNHASIKYLEEGFKLGKQGLEMMVSIPVMNKRILCKIYHSIKDRTITVRFDDLNWIFTGISVCHPNDDFNFQRGLRIAIARLVKEFISDQRMIDLEQIERLRKRSERYKEVMNGINNKYKLVKGYVGPDKEPTQEAKVEENAVENNS